MNPDLTAFGRLAHPRPPAAAFRLRLLFIIMAGSYLDIYAF